MPSLTKESRSVLFAVVEIVGADPPGNFTLVNEAVNAPTPVYKNNKKLLPATAVGIVNTQSPVRVQVCTFPFVNEIV